MEHPAPGTMNRARTLAIGALHFCADLYSLFFPIYMVVAGLDPARAALIFAVSSLAANGLQPAMGLWSDRVRGKLPVFLGLTVGAIGMSLIGLTRSYAALGLLVVVGRLGISLFHPAGSNIAGDAGGQRRELGFSIFLAIGIAGGSLSQPYFSLFTERFGNPASILLALPALLLAGLYLSKGRMTIAGPRQSIDLAQAARSLRGRLAPLLLLLAIMTLRYGFMTAIGFFAAKIFADWGFSRAAYSSAATFYNLAGAAGLLLSGVIAHRVRLRTLFLVSQLGFLPFLALLLWFGARAALWPALAALSLTGFVLNLSQVANITMGHRLLPEMTSTVSGILMGLAWAIGEFALPLGAAFSGAFSWAPGLASGLVTLVLMPLVASLLTLLLPREQPKVYNSRRELTAARRRPQSAAAGRRAGAALREPAVRPAPTGTAPGPPGRSGR
jgi:FSR family fosmidomycin resistance protein-like MFS transporter